MEQCVAKPKLSLVLGDINFETEGGLLTDEAQSKWFYFEPHADYVRVYSGDLERPTWGSRSAVEAYSGQTEMTVPEAIWNWGHYYGFHNFDVYPIPLDSEEKVKAWLAGWEVDR